ncbi:hypothetical protein L313_2492 [Acinetobacter haemolyticus CIP 64.3 = MTCC 9819]|nr:hypothetical protein L313_2492 [Acinetobacter haemolyticus CIP 64.3 = MTCC 9819]
MVVYSCNSSQIKFLFGLNFECTTLIHEEDNFTDGISS